MIFVRIELWPKGDPRNARLLGEATITNVGGTEESGDYRYLLAGALGFRNALEPLATETKVAGELGAFPRLRAGAWDLLCFVLADARRRLGGEIGRGSP